MRLSEIDWGDDAAEKDSNLLSYFVTSDSIERLTRRQKGFVIGRKGAGKSALRKKLLEHFSGEQNTFVVSIAPKYSSIRNILNDELVVKGFGEEIFFQYTWLRQMLLECLCSVGVSGSGKLTSGHAEFARQLAKERLSTPPDLVENVSNILTKLKVKAGKLGELGLSIERELRAASEIEALEHNVKGLAIEGLRFVVLVDDLDLGWDNSSTSNKLLLGLLSAYTYLSSLSSKIYVCVFLREDVYGILMSQSPQSDKYRNVEKLRWDREKLISLLAKRINFARKQHGLQDLGNAFHAVFPETVSTSNTDNWLTERTLARPRELIQFARYYTEMVESEGPDAESLKSAELSYSDWKLTDLSTEYMNQYPKLDAIFSMWRTHFFRRKYHLSRAEIDEMLVEVLIEAAINEPWFNALAEKTDTLGLLKILYEVGFIGDYVKGGDRGSRTLYSFADQHQPTFEEVQVHPCFRKAVGTVERIRTKKTGLEIVSEVDQVSP